jgi:hypothetical protein
VLGYFLLMLSAAPSLGLSFVAGTLAGRRRLAREIRPLLADMQALAARLDEQ